ncbi:MULTISPECIES: HhoA/HhoB/HtrA family serine endopeptidase [Leptolyngbya]|jgi:S1-C subfamily serine protease|uniref:Peptidase S1 and S6 chymotrypsin/Hap n=1 Tax=Leptolyngbya boryana NIES-2135 TaxID=1973484 RepID=A0A1Z4JN95_LEPBY|nr:MULTISPECIES: HhoA/HhoB/HtrA family serine endopeptidase [Leptolyngbya]BAY58118.1 peptidase S1 and S6 chymotrypsin/Hap [Leptolyngbya boryana NIES-2135]MBD2369103.1 trypsin-like peptidase domain-containing protein [Leptolyngbya sp. FACHB-161]MBD2375550.1 trypsin-like peptidase domain-containing protein [Leptolyngbya sp. FACHB-238]MBD2400124.1 trypsin-like peptidase domain-containing protein [Leptolyngbya sp. FACHB-239]MBD2406484.1 trypsin-like peptidase domain-containing protein [Leptolyngby
MQRAQLSNQLRRIQIAIVTLALMFGFTLSLPQSVKAETIEAAQPAPRAITRGSFVAEAVQKVGKAVVRIDTEKTVTRRADPMLDDPMFRRFFGEDFAPRSETLRGQGSGFVIEKSGIILTNSHVVNGADKVTVTLKDGRVFEGKVRGFDEVTDLAVVKVEGKDLPTAPLADSDQVQVGDWAIAVGNPLGLDNTVTLGIVSTLHRSSAQIGLSDKRLDFLQTDAAINPGNSGGPLLNDRGEVIGINTAIRPDAMGIGFAIPINKAKSVKDALAKGEKIPHPYIGVQMTTLTPEIARQNNTDPNSPFEVPEVNGVIVVRVVPNSPAAAAGFRRGDVVTEIDGQAISKAEQLQALVENVKPGQTLKVQVQRGKQMQQLLVKPAELQDVG